MKQCLILFLAAALAVIAPTLAMERTTGAAPLTLEWYEITKDTYSAMQPVFDELKPVFVEAFSTLVRPYVYATAPNPVERDAVATITTFLHTDWSKKLEIMRTNLQDKRCTALYLAVAKDEKQQPTGFALLRQENVKELIMGTATIIDGSLDIIDQTPDTPSQFYGWVLAVRPSMQKRGVATALVHAVVQHCPRVKKVYLTTSAHELNKNTQTFYEHLGLRQIATIAYTGDLHGLEFWRIKRVYMYKRP